MTLRLQQQRMMTIRLHMINYMVKAIWISFAVLLLVAFSYVLVVGITAKITQPIHMFTQLIIIIVPFVLGYLIDKKHPGHTIALQFLVMAYASSVSMIVEAVDVHNQLHPLDQASILVQVAPVLGHIMWLPGVFFPLFLMPLYFPAGKLLSPIWRIPVIFVLFQLAIWSLGTSLRPWPWPLYGIPDLRSPNGIAGTEALFDAIAGIASIPVALMYLVGPLAVFLRYRSSDSVGREQIKWPITAIVFLLVINLVFWAIPEFGMLDAQNGYTFTWFVSMLFPISIGIAILRQNLFDIDLVINRALVYGILTLFIIAVYVLTVSILGEILRAQTNVLNGLIATGIIAVIFHPLREYLQKIVNRLLYGQRDDPELLFSRIVEQLQTSNTPSNILPNLVQTIAHVLKIPYVSIYIFDGDDDMAIIAEWGKSAGQREMITLIHNNDTIGQLVVSARSKQEYFTKQERMILNTIAALTATTVKSVQLAEELSQSRQRIVTAREEERRRIRRDLHDGLGPALAAHMIQMGSARALVTRQPALAETILEELENDLAKSLGDIRRLVYNLRPPELDQLGLMNAIEDFVHQCNHLVGNHLIKFTLITPTELPTLPAAVEVAAYRIIQEAINNVIRHSKAHHSTICLECNDQLLITIKDDGIGMPSHVRYGVGLNSMRERAEELGGRFRIQSYENDSTIIIAELPVSRIISSN